MKPNLQNRKQIPINNSSEVIFTEQITIINNEKLSADTKKCTTGSHIRTTCVFNLC